MILRDFHEILQKFQSLDEADIVDNKIGNQEDQEDQEAEELIVSEDVRAAQSEEELLQRTEEYDEIDVVEQHLDEDLDGGEHLEVTKHLTEGDDGGDYPSESGKSDENKHREDILQMEEKNADEKEPTRRNRVSFSALQHFQQSNCQAFAQLDRRQKCLHFRIFWSRIGHFVYY